MVDRSGQAQKITTDGQKEVASPPEETEILIVNGNKRACALALLITIALLGCSHKPKTLKTLGFIAAGHQSVFAQTKEHFRVEYDSSAVGVFFKSIDGFSQSKTAYWLYFINGKSALRSADAIVPQMGDTIEWRLTSGY